MFIAVTRRFDRSEPPARRPHDWFQARCAALVLSTVLVLHEHGQAALQALHPAVLGALRAAGLNGVAPHGGGAFKTLVSQLTSNAEWLILTAIGLFLTAAAGALIFGVRSAPDWLFKAGLGLLLLLVGVPAVLA